MKTEADTVSSTDALAFVSIDVLRLLPESRARSPHILVYTIKLAKLTKIIFTAGKTASMADQRFINDWTAFFGIQAEELTKKRTPTHHENVSAYVQKAVFKLFRVMEYHFIKR